MRRNQGLLLGLGLMAVVACDDGAVTNPPAPTGTAGVGTTAGTAAPTAGTMGVAGTGTPPTAGTGTPGTAGTGTTAGTGVTTAGTGATAGTGTSTSGTGAGGAGMSGSTSGTGGGTPSGTPGFAMCGGAPKTGACKSKSPGIYAMKTEVDVWFMDEINTALPLFDPGRSKLTIYFRGTLSDVCEDGSGGKALMHPCGTRLPALYAGLNGGVIQIEFPDDLWEKPGIPNYETKGSTTGFEAGETLTIAKTTGLVGVDLMNLDAAWPSYMQTLSFTCKAGKGEACFPDMDMDGKPGVTVNIKLDGTPPEPYPRTGGWKYIPAPTNLITGLAGDGATKVHIGLRTRLGGSGKIGADCASGAGSAEAQDFESRAISCVLQDGSACAPADAEFVDQNVPIFHVLQAGQTPPANWTQMADPMLDRTPSKGPQSSVVRLGDLGATVSCADIRGATYPAFL